LEPPLAYSYIAISNSIPKMKFSILVLPIYIGLSKAAIGDLCTPDGVRKCIPNEESTS
jgi:hypothetical protein